MCPPSNGSSGKRLNSPTNTFSVINKNATSTQPDSVACTASRPNPTTETKRSLSDCWLFVCLLSVVNTCQYWLIPLGENRAPSALSDSPPICTNCRGASTNDCAMPTLGTCTLGAIPA